MANLPLLATASTVVLYYTAYSTAVLLALNVVLYMLALAKVPKTAFAARCLAAYFCLVACALYGVVASVALRLVGREQIAQWTVARAFKHSMRSATGVTFDVQDPAGHLSRTRPAVFVGNHQTELDVLVLGCMFPKYCSVTAKSSLRHVPVLGWFMSLSGTVFIDRKNTKDARQAMAGAADTMQTRRQSVFMFPEGTRSYSKEPVLLPFKKGAFHLAVQAKVPIVPIVVANYSHILWVKGMVFRPGTVPVKGEPIRPTLPGFPPVAY